MIRFPTLYREKYASKPFNLIKLVKGLQMWLIFLLLASIVFIVFSMTKLKLHPFLALLIAAFGYGILCGNMSLEEVVASVNAGFGGTIGYIGIVILAGCVIGTFLEKSGGAYKVAETVLKVMGQKNVPLAMSIIGYFVSIPVFCDSGFVILSPLAKALSRKAKISLASTLIALSLGLYATHTMVPPTPGPVAAAAVLGADLGQVIMWGLLVSIITLFAGWVFAVTFAKRVHLKDEENPADLPSPEALKDAPSAFKSVIPIFIPLFLIILRSISQYPTSPFGSGNTVLFLNFIGQPVVALLIGVFLSLLLPKKLTTEMLSASGWVGQAILSGATIIIITGCGGAFGKVLQNSGIADVLESYIDYGLGCKILLPFLIAAALKTAQGSSTVAIVVTAGIMVSLLEPLGLDSDTGRALTVIAIGAGSMVVSHVNDSFFWVVTQLSGMSIKQGYKLQTLGTLTQGLVAAITLYVISLIVL